MTHFLFMAIFALVVATIFGVLGREGLDAQFRYGLKVFLEFLGIGFVLAWLMYLMP